MDWSEIVFSRLVLHQLCDDGADVARIHEFAQVLPEPVPADKALHGKQECCDMQVSRKSRLKNPEPFKQRGEDENKHGLKDNAREPERAAARNEIEEGRGGPSYSLWSSSSM